MRYQAKKTEHTGAKHGSGAYWGSQKDAKKGSGKIRRCNWAFLPHTRLCLGARTSSFVSEQRSEAVFACNRDCFVAYGSSQGYLFSRFADAVL